mmetsp:Transcript_2392/g.3195  ORF Transcript_2392/g.3195 Transcript_2392/m.3195 type:complete len:309 (+) Transcript_2392:1869-2795(+)
MRLLMTNALNLILIKHTPNQMLLSTLTEHMSTTSTAPQNAIIMVVVMVLILMPAVVVVVVEMIHQMILMVQGVTTTLVVVVEEMVLRVVIEMVLQMIQTMVVSRMIQMIQTIMVPQMMVVVIPTIQTMVVVLQILQLILHMVLLQRDLVKRKLNCLNPLISRFQHFRQPSIILNLIQPLQLKHNSIVLAHSLAYLMLSAFYVNLSLERLTNYAPISRSTMNNSKILSMNFWTVIICLKHTKLDTKLYTMAKSSWLVKPSINVSNSSKGMLWKTSNDLQVVVLIGLLRLIIIMQHDSLIARCSWFFKTH